VLWSPRERRDWNTFSSELTTLYKRYKFWGANYFVAH